MCSAKFHNLYWLVTSVYAFSFLPCWVMVSVAIISCLHSRHILGMGGWGALTFPLILWAFRMQRNICEELCSRNCCTELYLHPILIYIRSWTMSGYYDEKQSWVFCGREWLGFIYTFVAWKLNHGNVIYPISHAYSVMLTGFCLEGRPLLHPSEHG